MSLDDYMDRIMDHLRSYLKKEPVTLSKILIKIYVGFAVTGYLMIVIFGAESLLEPNTLFVGSTLIEVMSAAIILSTITIGFYYIGTNVCASLDEILDKIEEWGLKLKNNRKVATKEDETQPTEAKE